MERMDIDPAASDWRAQCGKLLGKSERMVGYYREGYNIPRDTLLLMGAYVEGYRPKAFGHP